MKNTDRETAYEKVNKLPELFVHFLGMVIRWFKKVVKKYILSFDIQFHKVL